MTTTDATKRRMFFRQLARKSVVWLEESAGRRNLQLADLPQLLPAALATLKPQIRPDVVIIPSEGSILARRRGVEEPMALFAADEANLVTFNGFNGQKPIGLIANELCGATAWPPEKAFAHVRWMFLHLVSLQVCVPANVSPSEIDQRGGTRPE